MRGTLSRYLALMLAQRIAISVLGFVALLQLLAALDAATDVLDRGFGLTGIFRYLWLRLPDCISQSIALGVLVGSVITFSQLSRRREMVILRSAGVTIYRVWLIAMPVIALIALGHFVLNDRIVPRSQAALAAWWQSAPAEDGETKSVDPVWFRFGTDILSVGAVTDNGRRIDDLRLYQRGADGMLARMTTAPSATYDDGRWHLSAAQDTVIDGLEATVQPLQDRLWDTTLRPADLLSLANPAGRLASAELRRILEGEGAVTRDTAYYRTRLQMVYAAPFASFVMLAFGLVCAYAVGRAQRGDRQILVSLALGLAFMLVGGILNALGEAGVLPPFLAAWAALIVFASIAGAAVLRFEEP